MNLPMYKDGLINDLVSVERKCENESVVNVNDLIQVWIQEKNKLLSRIIVHLKKVSRKRRGVQ